MIDNKFISRDTFRKHKARKNEIPNQHKTCLTKQRENMWQKRTRENAEEREACIAYDKKQKRVKLTMETDEQHEKHLRYHHE